MYQDKRTKLYLPDSVRPRSSGYSDAGASLTRRALKKFNARSGSPNEDINWNNLTLRQRSRMLYMSSPLATSAINTNRTKAVGMGLTLKSTIDRETLGLKPEAAKNWQKHTEREFALWANRKAGCDATGMNNFAGMQQLALISWLMSGDVFALVKRYRPDSVHPYSLRLHITEADRVRTPAEYGGLRYPGITDGENPENHNRIFDGVETDAGGMVTAYYVHSNYPWQITGDPSRVTAQRGMLSRNPTFSMIVTISAGMVISEMLDSPEAFMMVDTIPWSTVIRANSSSIPWDTAA